MHIHIRPVTNVAWVKWADKPPEWFKGRMTFKDDLMCFIFEPDDLVRYHLEFDLMPCITRSILNRLLYATHKIHPGLFPNQFQPGTPGVMEPGLVILEGGDCAETNR